MSSNVLLPRIAILCYDWLMTTQNLELELRARLIECRGEWQVVAKDSGVSHSWISKFVNGHIPNPGYRTLSRLQEYLAPKAKSSPNGRKRGISQKAERSSPSGGLA